MTDKEKILNKIHDEMDGLMDAQGNFEYPEHEGAYHALCNLELYIDSLPEDVSEDLDEAAEEYNKEYSKYLYGLNTAFMAGANWQKQHDINKVCEWLKCQKEMIGISFEDDFIERFRKAMEDEKC